MSLCNLHDSPVDQRHFLEHFPHDLHPLLELDRQACRDLVDQYRPEEEREDAAAPQQEALDWLPATHGPHPAAPSTPGGGAGGSGGGASGGQGPVVRWFRQWW